MSPTFLKLRLTSWIPINAKGYQFDAHLWNKQYVQFIFNYVTEINDIHLYEGTYIVAAIFRTGPRATYVVRMGYVVAAATMLVTPGRKSYVRTHLVDFDFLI